MDKNIVKQYLIDRFQIDMDFKVMDIKCHKNNIIEIYFNGYIEMYLNNTDKYLGDTMFQDMVTLFADEVFAYVRNYKIDGVLD